MNSAWQSFLGTVGAQFDDNQEVSDFGQADAERAAAKAETVLAPLSHLSLIECSGDDVTAFLHGQFTSDIKHLTPGKVQHSAWCSAKGRMQASFLVWRHGETYRLALAADLHEGLQKRLQMYILRAKVKLTSQADSHVLLGLAGPQAATSLSAAGLPVPAAALESADLDGKAVLRVDGERFILALPVETATALWPTLAAQARPVGVPVWRWLDVQAALPLVTAATKEEFVPQMADFERIGGVSFQKGCYPGQEVVARTQYLGKVKRHLYRVSSSVALKAGDELFNPDYLEQAAGMVVSAAPAPEGGFAALAVVQSNYSGDVRLASREGPAVQAVAVNP